MGHDGLEYRLRDGSVYVYPSTDDDEQQMEEERANAAHDAG